MSEIVPKQREYPLNLQNSFSDKRDEMIRKLKFRQHAITINGN